MQAAELALISASLGEKPSARSAMQAPVSDADMRLREIRQIRRDDPLGWDQNKALQQEELSLIEAQLASRRPAEVVQNELQPAPAASGETGETNGSI
jgi:hypothetical protein